MLKINKNIILTTTFWSAGLILFSYLLFYKLGFHPFLDWDESIYAQVAKEAIVNHKYLDFTYWGTFWPEKPPLPIWFTIFGFKLFGFTELGGRFFVAIFALLTCILTYFIGKEFGKNKVAAILSVLALLICHHFFLSSFFLNFDTFVGFFIGLAVLSFKKAETNSKFYYIFWVAIALGILSKNVVGLLPFAIILPYSISKNNFSWLKEKTFYLGLILFLAIIIPWHIFMTIKFGSAFWNNYLLYHVFTRFSNGVENNTGPFWTYLDIFKLNYVLAPLTIISFIYFLLKSVKDKSYLLLPISCLVIFFFFSFAKTKGYGYIVPIYPFLSSMIGVGLFEIFNFIENQKIKVLCITVMCLVFLGLGLQYNNYKITRWGSEMYFFDNKFLGQWLKFYHNNENVYIDKWFYGGPAASFYFEKYLGGLPENIPHPTPEQLKNTELLVRPTRTVYQQKGYIYISK